MCFPKLFVPTLYYYVQWRINHDANDAMAWGPPLKGAPEQLSDFFGMGPISAGFLSMVDYLAFFDDQHGNSTMGPP